MNAPMATDLREDHRTPGRPRSAQVHQAIIDAALELLAEEGYAALTIEAVACRARVGKATIYRRWPCKLSMVIEILHDQAATSVPLPDTGSVRGDLRALLRSLAAAMTGPYGKVVAGITSELPHNPELAEAFRKGFVHARRKALVELLERAVRRGELRCDLDPEVLADCAVGAVFYRAVLVGDPLRPHLADQVVDIVIDGAASSSAAAVSN